MLTAERIKVDRSLDDKGWAVQIGESRWRFASLHFARQFASKMYDEQFASEILEHAHAHIWEKCSPGLCKGSLWQIIQGLE